MAQRGMIQDGTAVGMGIANAVSRLKDSKAKSKVIILLTDGTNNAGDISPLTAAEIAKRSRGTPRLANRLLKRVRDFAQVKYDGRITYDVACFALNLLEVDQYGLDKIDRRILQTMIVNFQGAAAACISA